MDDPRKIQIDNAHDNAAFDIEEVTFHKTDTQEEQTKKYDKDTKGPKLEEVDLMYELLETPPWYLTILLGMQHYLTMIGSTIAIPFILTPMLCIADDDPARGVFVSTIIFVSGIATLIQTTFGVRLPIIQGGTFAFLVPTIAILTTSFKPCDQYDFTNMTLEDRSELWHIRIREIQGDIMVASLFQTLIGFTGLVGSLLTWVTPLSITPTIALIGLSLYETAASKAQGNWGIAIFTILLLIAFSQYLAEWNVPVPKYNKSVGFTLTSFKLFKLFPVLLSIVLSWLLCVILTKYDVFAADNPARTDIKINVLHQAPWFYVPYPFQWGWPTVTLSGVFGMFAGVISSTLESIGDYYACARLSGIPPPPKHAINRGIGMESIGCILAGMFGTGNGTTSYAENIAAIRVTKVASRSVIQAGAVIMIFFGVFGKFGGLFITLPDPVLGGLFFVMFSLITAVGLSNLQFVNLNSSRNLFTLGFSLFIGLALPNWLKSNHDVIKTGSVLFDQVITVLLSTSMFVGGICGLVLDNTIPGTPEERGLDKWNELLISVEGDEEGRNQCRVYDLPFNLNNIFERWSCCTKVPISPTFTSIMKKETSKSVLGRIRHWLGNIQTRLGLNNEQARTT